MNFRHPFEWLPAKKRALAVVFVLMLVVGAGMLVIDRPLENKDAPWGILSFELAGELAFSKSIVESWGPKGQVYAGLSLGLDYLFLFAYGSFLSLACVLLAGYFSQRISVLYVLGIFFAWAVICAAILDALENFALIRILLGTQLDLWPFVARWSAIPKFAILISGLVYLVIAYIVLGFMTIRTCWRRL